MVRQGTAWIDRAQLGYTGLKYLQRFPQFNQHSRVSPYLLHRPLPPAKAATQVTQYAFATSQIRRFAYYFV